MYSADEFADPGKEPDNEFHIHTWADATLSEVAELLQQDEAASSFISSTSGTSDARLSFAVVYPGEESHSLNRKPLSLKLQSARASHVAPPPQFATLWRLICLLVVLDKRGKLVVKECGYTKTRRRSLDDDKTLSGVGFQAGDFLDVAVISGS